MDSHIDGPLSSVDGLDELALLYSELHSVHLDTATYRKLVSDPSTSWNRRKRLYADAIKVNDARYFIARDSAGTAIGYAFALPTLGSDDTFETDGIVELITLVVSESNRGSGVGRQLTHAVEDHARQIGADTIKVAVMVGNKGAEHYYLATGFSPGETLMYRPITDDERT